MAGNSGSHPTPLVQCNVGLVLPLMAVGLVTLVGLARAEKKKK